MDTHFDHENYRFNVVVYPDTEVPRRHLSAVDLDYIVDARYFLGCGGCCCGGNPHARKLQLRHMPKAGHTLRGGRGGRRGGQGRCGGGTLRIPFIYEDILAEHAPEGGEPTALATVPDLIALIDSQSGKPAGVPEYRYSCYVTVLDIPCSPRWSETKRGIEVGGPKGYGYDLEYRPLGKYAEPRSVISGIAP